MAKELSGETGQRNVFVRTSVYLRLEWPVYFVKRLPDDLSLVLSGPDIPTQQKNKSDGVTHGDLVRFEFHWDDKAKSVQLTASGDGRTVELWEEQVAGNLEAQLDWNERIHLLLAEAEDIELAGDATGASEMPADLRYDELQDLLRSLA